MAAVEEFTRTLDDPAEGLPSGERYPVREVYRLAKTPDELSRARYTSIEGSYVRDRIEILVAGEWKPLGPVLSSHTSVGRCP